MTKLLGMYCGIVAATAVLSAQTPTTPTTPSTSSSQATTTSESGQPMTITGCISPDTTSKPGASTMTNQRFILSNVQPPAGATTAAQSGNTAVTSYILAPGADVSLSQHLNHKVQITGTVDASRTTTSSSSSTSPSTASPSTTSSATQSSTASSPTFRVTSVKILSESCP
jgi:hypothetical protein